MQYMLLIYGDEANFGKMSPAEIGSVVGAYQAYTEAMVSSGVWVAGDRLQSVSNATSVRGQGADVQIHDGPFAETKEQLAGYYLIEAPDLDAALTWAKKCPGTKSGCVEVRPVFAMPPA